MAERFLRVFVNQFPWNELLMRGKRACDGRFYAAEDPKTGYLLPGVDKLNARDPKSDRDALKNGTVERRIQAEGYKYVSSGFRVRGLVLLYTSGTPDWEGMDEANYSRRCAKKKLLLPEDFPSRAIVGAAEIFASYPYEGTVFLRNIRRFMRPIGLKFNPGPVRWNKAPLSLVEGELRKVGLLDLAQKCVIAA